MNEPEYETGLPHTASTEHYHSVIVALFRHLASIMNTIPFLFFIFLFLLQLCHLTYHVHDFTKPIEGNVYR